MGRITLSREGRGPQVRQGGAGNYRHPRLNNCVLRKACSHEQDKGDCGKACDQGLDKGMQRKDMNQILDKVVQRMQAASSWAKGIR